MKPVYLVHQPWPERLTIPGELGRMWWFFRDKGEYLRTFEFYRVPDTYNRDKGIWEREYYI